MVEIKTKEENITEDEAALYDRQIRLWGLDAQKRLRAARVLLIGASGLGAEVAKNIVLSGIKSLTLLDHGSVTKEDFCCQFLIDREDLGQNRAVSSLQRTRLLNPMVEVTADTDDVSEKPDEFFTNFDIICATCCTEETLLRVNNICKKENIRFFAGDVWGFYSYTFADLNEHEYADEVEKKPDGEGEPSPKKAKSDHPAEKVTVKKNMAFCSLKSALNVDWEKMAPNVLKKTPPMYFLLQVMLAFRKKYGRDPSTSSLDEDKAALLQLRQTVLEEKKLDVSLVSEDFVNFCFAELSPVCAVAGGVLGQEIIKAVSHKDQPHNNFFFYNGRDGSGLVDKIGCV